MKNKGEREGNMESERWKEWDRGQGRIEGNEIGKDGGINRRSKGYR